MICSNSKLLNSVDRENMFSTLLLTLNNIAIIGEVTSRAYIQGLIHVYGS